MPLGLVYKGREANTVSELNGDKARFGRERKRKALRRKKNRELQLLSRRVAANPPQRAQSIHAIARPAV